MCFYSPAWGCIYVFIYSVLTTCWVALEHYLGKDEREDG